ncbi:MAG TPA: hypothetical protein VE713_19325, partial [Pyrinomonadaceae bacterium]|nr:hypothetical protein [Pyrinomonadaceae bacterium]
MTVGDAANKPIAFAYEQPNPRDRRVRGLTFDHDITNYGKQYNPADYRTEHGHWADFISPTALCETRRYFNAVNTWDRGIFSFGFVQMIVKDADAQFIRLFRRLLETPKAADYFPDLSLREVKGRKYIHLKSAEGKYIQLETKTDARGLQKYLNPTRAVVEPAEAECAARFAH